MSSDLNEYLTFEIIAKYLNFESFINYSEYVINKHKSDEITIQVKKYLDKHYPVSYFEKWLDIIINDIKSFKEIPFMRTSRKIAIKLLTNNINTFVICPTNKIEVLCLIFNEKGIIKTIYLGCGNYGNFCSEKMKTNMAEISVNQNDERIRVYSDLKNYSGLNSYINRIMLETKNIMPLF
jgi:hypothetical protein